jgi:hypothetical protein
MNAYRALARPYATGLEGLATIAAAVMVISFSAALLFRLLTRSWRKRAWRRNSLVGSDIRSE